MTWFFTEVVDCYGFAHSQVLVAAGEAILSVDKPRWGGDPRLSRETDLQADGMRSMRHKDQLVTHGEK